MQILDEHVQITLRTRIGAIEKHFSADAVFFYGPIYPGVEKHFRDFIEKLRQDGSGPGRGRLVVLLNTPGGSAETVEKLVDMIRFHYEEVFFVVPDSAMSAGTIFCMSGDRIYMDYSSSLGPIDPQVHNGKEWVPALGYLDQVEKMIARSADNKLTNAELIILQNLDLAMLSRYEQAKNLTITLLKKWLVDFKFKDWATHKTDPGKKGKQVTREEKEERAKEIAAMLSDNKHWHSHGRMIGQATLQGLLRLEINDYSADHALRQLIRDYNDLLVDYVMRQGYPVFLHSRNYF
jgi:hypothetical protein